ncbi:cell envelope integrity protein CreD [Pseudoduganella namucuonensis]|uniref:Inner membrane protein n=1 Tax=Pseudoduganella namucuonensis TaxID=1035707 RepID=A0A1I7KFR5_9BURK|nr:cell envelope integrity protein CreD [Pseudoduganella namucuonensis]SFU96272.1 inner membrane protein [Pseudoduganella namucuonensis]
MQKKLIFKLAIIAALMLLIGVPLLMIQATIRERMAYRDEAARSIASDSVGQQTVIGPVLVIPYTETVDVRGRDGNGNPTVTASATRRQHLVYPNELRVTGRMGTERRYRGIHQVLVYGGQYDFSGDFTLPTMADLPRADAQARVALAGRPYLSLPIEDVRGLRDIPRVNWDGQPVEFEQGARLGQFQKGLHARLGEQALAAPAQVKFAFALNLAGMERQHFVPVGKNNIVSLTSGWPHPQFGGRFLPEQRSVTDAGFQARWRVPSLASNVQQQLTRMAQAGWNAEGGAQGSPGTPGAQAAPRAGGADELDHFSVAFVEPVNIYSQADRATKYGLLFVALTFAAFFVFEVLKRLPIHPVQYALVGLALVLFFLLLVSLSEHFPFVAAYLVASGACIALTGYYLAHVLRDWRRGLAFGAALTLLYGALYGLLSSESNALALGALLLFATLAAVMVATRKVDWYQIGD